MMKEQKKLDLEIETIGEPSVEALPEAEQKAFFETLLDRIKDLKAEDDKKKESENQDDNT